MRYARVEVEVGLEGSDAWSTGEYVVEYFEDDDVDITDIDNAEVFEQVLQDVSIIPLKFLYECDEYGNEIGEDE